MPYKSEAAPNISENEKVGDRYPKQEKSRDQSAGAASDLSALYLGWLDPAQTGGYGAAAAACTEISTICKSLIMKVARAVNARRTLDSSASFDAMALAWDRATAGLRSVQ